MLLHLALWMQPVLQHFKQPLLVEPERLDPHGSHHVLSGQELRLLVVFNQVFRLRGETHLVQALEAFELRPQLGIVRLKDASEHFLDGFQEFLPQTAVLIVRVEVIIVFIQHVLEHSLGTLRILHGIMGVWPAGLAEAGDHVEHANLPKQNLLDVLPARSFSFVLDLIHLLFHHSLQV